MANPVLSDKAFNYASSYENENTMTLNGAINKSIILTLVLMLSAMVSVFFVLTKRPEMIYPAALGSSIAAFVLALIMTFKKELAKVFSAKVQMNSKKTNIKSRLLGQLISGCFTVSMDVPTNGFFKDQSMNSSPEYPVYVRTMTYGKIALLAIESEYSFEEVKKAVEAGIKFKFFSGGANYTAKDMEIIQKSTITILVISDDTSGEVNQYFDSLDALKGAFSTKYTELNYGMPILCTGYYAIDNKIFKANVRLRSEPWPAPVTSSSGKSRPAPRPSYP